MKVSEKTCLFSAADEVVNETMYMTAQQPSVFKRRRSNKGFFLSLFFSISLLLVGRRTLINGSAVAEIRVHYSN